VEKGKDRLVVAVCHVNDPGRVGKRMVFGVQLMKPVITPHTAEMVGCT
jgi:hypothetical protein